MKFKERLKKKNTKRLLNIISIFYTTGLLLSLGSLFIFNFAFEKGRCYLEFGSDSNYMYCNNFAIEKFINYLDLGLIFFVIFFYLSPIVLFGSLSLLFVDYKDKNLKHFFCKSYFYSFILSLMICLGFLIKQLEIYLLNNFILS